MGVTETRIPPRQAAQTHRELLGTSHVAALLGVSKATIKRWHNDGLIPDPLRLGGRVLWRLRELIAWLDAGAPPKDRWRFRPTLAANLEELIALKRTAILELEEELRNLQSRAAAGHTKVNVTGDWR